MADTINEIKLEDATLSFDGQIIPIRNLSYKFSTPKQTEKGIGFKIKSANGESDISVSFEIPFVKEFIETYNQILTRETTFDLTGRVNADGQIYSYLFSNCDFTNRTKNMQPTGGSGLQCDAICDKVIVS